MKNKFLVVSNQTAFAIDYLVDVVGQIDISSGTFNGLAKQYNRFHLMKLPFDVQSRIVELSTDLLNDAFFSTVIYKSVKDMLSKTIKY